jgi:hypothetical protein
MATLRTNLLFALALAASSMGIGCSEKPQTSKLDVKFVTKLTEADRKEAVAQKLCPVSEGRIGAMGLPIKVTDDGRHFFICCDNCKSDAMEKFDDYFAKAHATSGNAAE